MITLSGIRLLRQDHLPMKLAMLRRGWEDYEQGDVGFISLNEPEPTVTDVAFMDIQIGNSS